MKISRVELLSADLEAQRDFYAQVLDLPVRLGAPVLEVQAGRSRLFFTEAPEFDGAYHFAFNIPTNQFEASKRWMSSRVPLLRDESGREEFHSESWNSSSVYFKDAAGNILELIARHNLENAAEGEFDSRQILYISEIGLPSEDVVALANELCTRLGVEIFRQQANPDFTPVGDDEGLLILPRRDRIWMPNSGVPARLLSVRVEGEANGRTWDVRGVPYEITNSK
jgi:catechol 2,3-dioxygenase-like lactoylglutathione lyase family enzyme